MTEIPTVQEIFFKDLLLAFYLYLLDHQNVLMNELNILRMRENSCVQAK